MSLTNRNWPDYFLVVILKLDAVVARKYVLKNVSENVKCVTQTRNDKKNLT